MSKKLIVIGGVVLLVLLSALGYAFLRTPESASSELEAIPLNLTPAGTSQTTIQSTPTQTPEQTQTAADEPAPAATESVADAETVAPAGGQLVVVQIMQSDSQVRFELDEDLRGQRITVVGTTSQVAGEIAFNLSDLSQTQVGILQINARTLQTDNDFRNRAIQNQILDTGPYEFITFTPSAINDLPPSAAVGDTITFTIDGDLTIRDITLPATFTVQVMVISETEISGTASAIVTRSDYELTIPSVPNVANVEQEVELYIDFVANVVS